MPPSMTTTMAAKWITDKAIVTPDSRWAVVAVTRELAETLLPPLIEALPEAMVARVRRSWPNQIDLNNGATIRMLSGDPRANNRGYSLDGAWFHGDVNRASIDALIPALIMRGGGFVETRAGHV